VARGASCTGVGGMLTVVGLILLGDSSRGASGVTEESSHIDTDPAVLGDSAVSKSATDSDWVQVEGRVTLDKDELIQISNQGALDRVLELGAYDRVRELGAMDGAYFEYGDCI